MDGCEPSRVENEIALLSAMYPEQTSYAAKARELRFTQDGALLELRLPESYPELGMPDVIAASDASRSDLRTDTKAAVKELGLVEGEESLDAIIAAFQQILGSTVSEKSTVSSDAKASGKEEAHKTVIIWLHHLVALKKRKLALSSTTLAGVTKSGYPAVMIFSGPASDVTDHVNTLKAENWLSFHVRYEEDVLWNFAHGKGVKEVEKLRDVVKEVEVAERQKEELFATYTTA